MGSMPSYFSVFPLPAKVPTNAAILASHYAVGLGSAWTVTVVDGKTPIEVRMELFAGSSGPGATYAITPTRGWPAKRSLEVVAVLPGTEERRHPFETAKSPLSEPPRCDWRGPSTIQPKDPAPSDGMWPTNIPRPPKNLRTFSLPPVYSEAGYMVQARICLQDRGKRWSSVVGLRTEHPDVQLTPAYGDEFSDDAQLVGIEVTDLAGNVSRYGEVD